MGDTTVIKMSAAFATTGLLGQRQLVSGARVALRMWENEQPGEVKQATASPYETVGYVLAGEAELHIEGQMVRLEPGDAWVVPQGALHRYQILEPFTAIEATSPPAI